MADVPYDICPPPHTCHHLGHLPLDIGLGFMVRVVSVRVWIIRVKARVID